MSTRLLVFLPLFAWAFALAQAGDLDLSDGPAEVRVEGEGFTNALKRAGGTWTDGRVTVTFAPCDEGRTAVRLSAPDRAVEAVRVSWRARFPRTAMMLSDDWCGLGWRPIGDARSSAWYFLVSSGGVTDGFGVMTQPASIAHWTVRPDGVSLFLDVSAGGYGVRLRGRELEACTLVSRRGCVGETAFEAGRAFCRMMCPVPRLPREPVFGYNDWYCAYGANTATNFLADAAYVAALAKGLPSKPFVVMDDGWQPMSPPAVQKKTGKLDSGWGPWDRASDAFGMTMPDFAARIAALGAKPGLWYRPMRAWDEAPDGWKVVGHPESFDPTVPAVMEAIRADMRRFRAWGFALVKMDFLVYDFNGHYLLPGTIGETVFRTRRPWRDRSRTSAERMLDLYRALREEAGDEITLIGCGAFGHLAAGLFEVNRVGFDTSGKDWKRTAANGPHALGMRSIQHNTFYCIDADCVGLAEAGAIPWEKNRQWMDLLARSKTAFFVSWKRSLATDEIRAVMTEAFRTCAQPGDVAEPLDWMSVSSPRRWRFCDGTEASYDWLPEAGLPDAREIALDGEYDGHLQDVWYDGASTLWWAHTDTLVKTDLSGCILARAQVGGHHAGLEVRDGRLYTAVCAFNGEPRRKTTPACHVMIGEYDAETLERIEMHVLDINDRAGSLTMLDDGSFLVGCLRPDNITTNQVRFHHIGRDYRLIRSHVIDDVPVRLGIETIKRQGDFIFLSMYGRPNAVKLDRDFKVVAKGTLGGQCGMVVDGTNLWVGITKNVSPPGAARKFVSKLVRRKLNADMREFLFGNSSDVRPPGSARR